VTGPDGVTVTWRYTYDAAGNMTSKSNGTDTTLYGWDSTNHLIQATLPDGSVLDYTYDEFGRMLSSRRSTDAGPTTYVWAGEEMVQETAPDGTVTNYTYVDGMMTSFTRGGEVYTIHADPALGHVRSITDAQGMEVFSATSDAWGNSLTVTDNVPGGMPYGYVGAYGVRWDASLGMYCMHHRWYNNEAQQFLSVDPLHDNTGPYKYACNTPNSRIDPFGLRSTSDANNALASLIDKNLPAAAPSTVKKAIADILRKYAYLEQGDSGTSKTKLFDTLKDPRLRISDYSNGISGLIGSLYRLAITPPMRQDFHMGLLLYQFWAYPVTAQLNIYSDSSDLQKAYLKQTGTLPPGGIGGWANLLSLNVGANNTTIGVLHELIHLLDAIKGHSTPTYSSLLSESNLFRQLLVPYIQHLRADYKRQWTNQKDGFPMIFSLQHRINAIALRLSQQPSNIALFAEYVSLTQLFVRYATPLSEEFWWFDWEIDRTSSHPVSLAFLSSSAKMRIGNTQVNAPEFLDTTGNYSSTAELVASIFELLGTNTDTRSPGVEGPPTVHARVRQLFYSSKTGQQSNLFSALHRWLVTW
jgi:RHS repeat-associated protein